MNTRETPLMFRATQIPAGGERAITVTSRPNAFRGEGLVMPEDACASFNVMGLTVDGRPQLKVPPEGIPGSGFNGKPPIQLALDLGAEITLTVRNVTQEPRDLGAIVFGVVEEP